jgi:hypothetical protein
MYPFIGLKNGTQNDAILNSHTNDKEMVVEDYTPKK